MDRLTASGKHGALLGYVRLMCEGTMLRGGFAVLLTASLVRHATARTPHCRTVGSMSAPHAKFTGHILAFGMVGLDVLVKPYRGCRRGFCDAAR